MKLRLATIEDRHNPVLAGMVRCNHYGDEGRTISGACGPLTRREDHPAICPRCNNSGWKLVPVVVVDEDDGPRTAR